MKKIDTFNFLLVIVTGVISSLMAWALTQNLVSILVSVSAFIVLVLVFPYLYLKAKKIVAFKKCGIKAIHTNQYEAEKSIKIKLKHVSSIDILTIRGLGIFALKDSLIKKIIIEKAGQIKVRVLFLDPDSEYVKERAKEVGEDYEAFRQGIILCKGYLQELKTLYNINIQARMYNALPVWRLKFIDNCVFVSTFLPSKEGHHSAMYEIISDEDFSLFNSFKREFEYLYSISQEFI